MKKSVGYDVGSRRRVDSFEVSSVDVLKKCCFEEEGIALVLAGLAQLTNLGCEWWEEEGRWVPWKEEQGEEREDCGLTGLLLQTRHLSMHSSRDT